MDMNRLRYILVPAIALALVVGLGACGTRKNNGFRRSYHRLTSYFNYYFNADEAYAKGMLEAEKTMRYDYTRILPFCIAGREEAAQGASTDMGTAITKSSDLIKFHSITAKPKRSEKAMSPKQKEFYNQNEFNKYARRAWLLMGKAQLWSGELDKARETLEFSMRQFAAQPEGWEAQLWMARIDMLHGAFVEARERMLALEKSPLRPKRRRADFLLSSMWADLHIQMEDYPQALPHAVKAVRLSARGLERNRCQLALAQLYERSQQYPEAFALYKKVSRHADDYRMRFNATIRSAFLAAQVEGKSMDKSLLRMARDEKNAEYLDLIYYALAQIAAAEGDTARSIDLYKQSATKSVSNVQMKTVSLLEVGQYYFRHRDYLQAQAYYDSAMAILPESYPKREEVLHTAGVLNTLVANERIVQREDSLQRIARLSKAEQERVVRNIISDLRDKERLEQSLADTRRRAGTPATQGAGSSRAWYFYNPRSISRGQADFRASWGARRLEDNWRRKDKSLLELSGFASSDDASQTGQQRLTDRMPEYYLRHIPAGDSALRASDARIGEAYVAMGNVLSDELRDYPAAVRRYEQLVDRYPKSPTAPQACYLAYVAAQKASLADKAAALKSRLLSQYPESPYALKLSDPAYLERLLTRRRQNEELYAQGLAALQQGDRRGANAMAAQGLEANPSGEYRPQFELLSALSAGSEPASLEQVEALKAMTQRYPAHRAGAYAQDVLNAIKRRELVGSQPVAVLAPLAALEGEDSPASSGRFVYSSGEHYVGFIIPDTANLNTYKFRTLGFTVDYDVNLNLEVHDQPWGQGWRLILVKSFPNPKDAQRFYAAFRGAEFLADYRNSLMVISPGNLAVLEELGVLRPYMNFYNSNYR
ncbi:MAG: hypothetical protein CSA07_05330 [Bacteroidia bacterium]|nr:MAG: hypothetical protein CSA07_05330 [Bacteroidia bacterium]